jgi:hypothetical protein
MLLAARSTCVLFFEEVKASLEGRKGVEELSFVKANAQRPTLNAQRQLREEMKSGPRKVRRRRSASYAQAVSA